MQTTSGRLNHPFWALRMTYGLVPIVAGLDKFTNLLTDWTQYLSPLALKVLPFSASTFMHIVGVIEIAAGILVLSKLTRLGAYVVSAWLVAIALNLVTTGRYFDVAVRDVVMAVGAFALAKLAEARQEASLRLRTNTIDTARVSEGPVDARAHPQRRAVSPHLG